MSNDRPGGNSESRQRLEEAYKREKPRFLARACAAGRSLEEAEDPVHDVHAETLERLHPVAGIGNLPAWINSLLTRRLMDAWRRWTGTDRIRRNGRGRGHAAGDHLRRRPGSSDGFVRDSLMDALNDALRALPAAQRRVVEAQVFGGLTFREIAEATGTRRIAE